MMDFNSGNGLALGWHLHMVFAGLLIIAVVFLIVYAIKVMGKKELKIWTVWLVVIGLLGTLLTSVFGFRGMQEMMRSHHGGSDEAVWQEMSDHMKEDDHDDFETGEDLREHMLGEMEEHMGTE